MKQLLVLAGLMTAILSCSTNQPVNYDQLQDRSGLLYMPNQKEPFNGPVASYQAGHMVFEGQIRKGLRDGRWIYYYSNGQKQMEGTFADGLKEGTWTSWKENGELSLVEQYRMGNRLGNQPMADSSVVAAPEPSPTSAPTPGSGVAKKVVTQPEPEPAQAPGQVHQAPEQTQQPVTQKEPEKPKPVVWDRLRGGAVKTLDGLLYSGPVIKYYNSGQVELEGQFYNGHRSGKWTFYWPSGSIKDIKYY